LKGAGFKAEIRDLTYFQDDYGLKPVNGEDGDEEDVEVESDGEGESVDIEGSEGYEMIEGDDDDD
jgi:hypothetical protein